MEGYSGSECDRVSEISSIEDEVPEGLVEPQEVAELTNSLKDIIQNEDVKPKLQCIMSDPSFSMVTVQSEDSGITWETSSSRCSTPWASEASATSDLCSVESSSVDSPPGKVIFLMDEGKTVRKRMCKSSDRTSDLKGGQCSKKSDLSGMKMQELIDAPAKVQDAKLNAAELEAQAMDAETSKDKEDLLDITGESVSHAPIASKSMGKENKLKKGRPALNGAVRAKIQKFSSISEEETPTFFQKKSSKDPATPSDIKRKQKQQHKGFLNQSPSSPSLVHLEKDCTDGDDGSLHNIKHVKTNIESSSFSNAGVTVPLDQEERKETRSSPAETLHETSEQSLSFSPSLTEEEEKQEIHTSSPMPLTSISEWSISEPSDLMDIAEKEEIQPFPPETANVISEQPLSITPSLIDEGENQEIQPNSFFPTKTISTDCINEPEGQATQPYVSLSTESVSECSSSSHTAKETEKQEIQFYSPVTTQLEPAHSVLSEIKKCDFKPYPSITTQSKCEHPDLSYSIEEAEKQEIHPYSPVTAQLESEQLDISYSTCETEKQEREQLESEHSDQQDIQPNTPITAPSESEHSDLFYSIEEAEEQESYSPAVEQLEFENVDLSYPVDETETQGSQYYSQVTAEPESELSDLSYPIDEAEKQAAHLECEHRILSDSIEEAENEEIQPYLLVPTQFESEHLVLSETGSEEIEHYSPTTPQLESGHLILSYPIGDTETRESQCYSHIPAGLEPEHSLSYYSVDEVIPQEIQSSSPVTAQSMPKHLVLSHSIDDEEKKDIQPYRPKPAKSKCHSLLSSYDTDEAEMREIQLHSPKIENLMSEQLGTMSLMHTDDRDGQELQAYSLGTEYLLSAQLTAPSPIFIAESDKQEIQPDAHEVPDLVSEVLNFSAGSINEEEKHDIDSSLPDIQYTSSEQSMAVSSDFIDETRMQENQSYSAETDSDPSTQLKTTLDRPFNETEKLEIQAYAFEETALLSEESKTGSADPTNNNEADKQEIQSFPNEAKCFESKQFPGRLQTARTAQSANENKSDMTMVSDFVSNEVSRNLLSEPINESHTHNLYSSLPGNPVSDKNVNNVTVTSIGNLSTAEEIQHFSNVEAGSKEPEHYLPREEKLTERVNSAEESKYTPEPDEQKDMFNIISEGYEILNIHAVPLISSVDEEESKHMPDKLEYLETNTLIKTKPFECGDHEASAYGTAREISENSVADDTGVKDMEQKELVEEVDAQEIVETEEEISTVSENKSGEVLNPNEGTIEMDYFEKYTLIDDKSPTELSVQGLSPFDAVMANPKKHTEETISSTGSSDVNTLEDEFTLLDNDLDEAFYGMIEQESKMQSHVDAQKFLTMQKSIDYSKKVINIEDEQKLAGTPLFDTEEGVLERSMLFPTSVSAINPELLEEPPALAFLYKDLYAEAVGENAKGENEPPSDEESGNSDASFPRNSDTDDETGIYFEKYILKDDIPCNVAGSEKDEVSKAQSVNKDLSGQLRVSGDKHKDFYEVIEKEQQSVHILSEESTKTQVLSEGEIVEGERIPFISDIKVTICQPTQAVPFGSKLNVSDARNDPSSQREEENAPAATHQELSEQMSHEESSQVLDSEVTANQKEASVQDKSKTVTPRTDERKEQHEIAAVNKMDNYVPHGRTPVDESESNQYVRTSQQPEQLISYLDNHLRPMTKEAYDLDHDRFESVINREKYLLDTGEQTNEKRVGENIANDIAKHILEVAKTGLPEPGVKFDKASGDLDLQPFRLDFDNLPSDSTREDQCLETDEHLAESMDYKVITQEELLQDEISSELAHEDLLFEDRESFEPISHSYESVNEAEQDTPIEHEDSGFVMMNSEKSSLDISESESQQKEIKKVHVDTYCCQCRCPISAIDKLFGEHEGHDVTTLDTAVMDMKDQLDEFLRELQQKSVKFEELVSEIESLFNSVEENSKKNEQFLEDQNEEMVKTVIAHYDEMTQNFEEVKKMKMEYLYEQMVNFQQSIVTVKETLETTVTETEELDYVVFLNLSKEMNKRLLSAMDKSLSLEKMPSAFSLFDHYADGSVRSDQNTLKCVAVPQTPKLLPQEPNSATSTSIAIYWTVSEGDVIDCFQVYCMEEPQPNKDQSALVEEYRVTVKESYCILEDLEPDRYYGVWVMAVNYTGCSLPSHKSTFRTAPSTPLLKAEDCTVCWDTAIIRWSTANSEATKSFTLEYCRQYSPEGEGLRSFAGIKKPELQVNLQPNVNYFFYVRAANSSGTSEQSEAALISTKGTRFHVMSDTAHPALQVSSDGTVICLPERTKFTGIPSVLGELLPARGRHYWETTVTGCKGYRIGICCNSTPQGSILGQDDTSWCICCCSTQTSFIYKFFHHGVMSDVYMTEQPARVGILLDYNAGRLSFFNAERGLALFTIRHKFTNDAHPAFVLEKAGVLNLHTGMELPEFVKHS
ncbi:cardiomyopathy-associated protein 5 isoform X1 [Trachemys scripta elegans]|uniref:cardiomyopathy-associated protein 5 isoform X1 n=1 Tax=Trachemys scripta elegans TaxID=31138 RepID=UPI00155688CD|nr:cardiomyopathy-associated protein 5 isoform X1 [Trachemys scripta elegans]